MHRFRNFGRLGLLFDRRAFNMRSAPLPSLTGSNLRLTKVSCQPKVHNLCNRTLSTAHDQQKDVLDESDLNDHISKLHEYLVSFAIPKFFAIRHPWAIYSKNVYFENRLWDEVETAQGLDAYAWKLMRFRFGAILSYARSKLEVMGSRVDGREITIHWRFSGLPQTAVFFGFWRFRPWKLKQAKQENSQIIEAISTLYVGSDKLIHKHVIDRLVVDRNMEEATSKNALLEKFKKLRKLEEEKALT